MTNDGGYYKGWETKGYIAVEDVYGTASATGAEYVQFAYLRSLSWVLQENLERIYSAGSGYRRGPSDEVKGAQELTAHLEFWMADDFGASGLEPFLVKFPLDKYNVALATNTWSIPETGGNYPGDSAYGSYELLPFSLEFGWNKTNNIRRRIITGCYVNSQTFSVSKGEKCLWAWDIVGKHISAPETAFVGSGAQATGPPLDWSHTSISWSGEDDTLTAHTGMTSIEFTIANNLIPLQDLSLSTGLREPSNFVTDKRDITGTMTWYKKTTTGQKWFQIVASATVAATATDNTINLGEIDVTISSRTTGSRWIKYYLYDVTLGELPEDIDFEKTQECVFPFTARYYKCDIVTSNVANEMVNWNRQASI